MTTTIIIEIIIIIILIILSAFFSSSETALTTITPHRLRTMTEENYKNAHTLEKVLSNKEKMLSVILICNNIVNIAVSALSTVLIQKLFGNWAVSIGTGILTVLILVFGEISPKTIATYREERLALLFAPVIWFLMKVLTPLAYAVNFLSSGVLKLSGVNRKDKQESYTENEIRSIVEVSTEEGVIEDEEKDLINNVFDFTDKIAREVMVPRVNIVSISEESGIDEIRETYITNMYTRLPVSDPEGNSFVGMLNFKDFIFLSDQEKDDFRVEKYMRELPYTFENKHLSELFMEMKKQRINMMAVMDEYGETTGIITMEDLLEELVGEIRDEYDADEENELVHTGENEYEVPGSMSISDVNDRIGTELESDAYDSIGGLLMEQLERLPAEGDEARIGDIVISAEKLDGTRIETVKIRRIKDQ